MAGILCIVGFLLAGRLGWIQIARGSQYEEMAMNQTEGVQTLYSPRGTIYDTNGKELAFSIMVKSLYADPDNERQRSRSSERPRSDSEEK